MASAWNIVRASGYNGVPENDENSNGQSPLPDKFRQRFTVNSLRMSLRKRVPLKRINGNIPAVDNDAKMKKNKPVAKLKPAEVTKRNKLNALTVEKSVKKTFYRVSEQLTGTSKKSQLEDTPRKSPTTRYRERLRSPPLTPMSPPNQLGSTSCSTPVGQVYKSKRRISRTPGRRRSYRKTPRKAPVENLNDSDEFSHHLEMVACGIQQLEANGNNMNQAISKIGLDYESSPLQSKMRSGRNLRSDGVRRYAPINTEAIEEKAGSFNVQSTSNTVPGKLRRTVTRMSLRVKNTASNMRSSKSTSNINPQCYVGPMGQKQKLAPLHPSYSYN